MTSPAARPAGARVLIVADDAGITGAFSRTLRLQGLEVWAARSADDGVRLARAHLPQAVILALRVPLASALDLLRALRGLPGLAVTPAAVVTSEYAAGEDGRARDVEALGAELRFAPVWLDELVALAHELLNVPVRD